MGAFGKGSSGLSILDRIGIFGAAYSGDYEGARQIRDAPKKKQQEQMLREAALRAAGLVGPQQTQRQVPVLNEEDVDITAGFGPVMERGPDRQRTSQEIVAGLAEEMYRTPGFNPKPYLDMAQLARPNMAIGPDGRAYNQYDPSIAGQSFPKLGEGIQATPDGGARMVPNYDKAIAGIEGAKAGATEAAKAGYDMVIVKVGGQEVQLPRSVALPLITAAFGAANPGGLPADFGKTLTPEEQALRTGRAANTVKQEGMVGDVTTQAGLDYPKLRDQAGVTLSIIEQIRGHPSLGVRTGNSAITPPIRPEDVDFEALRSQVTGGAFLEAIASLRGTGQITEIEGKKATDAIARLSERRQSQNGFLKALADYESVVNAGLQRAERRAGGGSAVAGPSRAALEAEARRRGLLK